MPHAVEGPVTRTSVVRHDRRRYAAVVVSYNRREVLKDVLARLLDQTRELDAVIVVDNCSTDGSREMVRDLFPTCLLFEPGENLGGAGGFAWGVELAIALGFDAAWMMDDDAVPERDALAKLLERGGDRLWDEQLGFLCSTAVGEDGSVEGTVGNPIPSDDFARAHRAALDGTLAVDVASFLGILVNLHVARTQPLPYPDFFIWCDDVEYSSRLAASAGGVCVTDSRIVHCSPAMQALVSSGPLGWKFFYFVRNRLWLVRWGRPDATRLWRAAQVASVLRATRHEWRQAGATPALVRTTLSAWGQGLFRTPRPHPVGSLIDGSPDASRWLRTVAGARIRHRDLTHVHSGEPARVTAGAH